MNFKFQISNFKLPVIGLLMAYGLWLMASVFVPFAKADATTDNALNFLRAKQDVTGRINTGFSAPSQWSAIAFAVNNIDVSTVKSTDKSLLDFLMSDTPASGSAATDWENRILAIVAIGQDPTNFGGTNYVTNLETFYNNGQLGDTCSLNDDVFGLLALVAAGNTSTTQIKQDTLNFLISKQDPTDGGFGFSAPGCAWYSTSADMTGAALQALIVAKNNGLVNVGLDDAITKAKNYLLTNQDTDGGFGYFGSSDTDTTGWVLQAFNVLGMKDSTQAVAARTYLLSQQSSTDGGIMAFDYGTNTFVSNSSTTAQAIIAISGKSWVTKIFDPSQTATPTPTTTISPTVTPAVTPTTTMTVTPTPTPNQSLFNNSPTPTPTSTVSFVQVLTPTPTNEPAVLSYDNFPTVTEQPTSAPEVLGAKDEVKIENKGINKFLIAKIFAGIGVLLIFIYIVKPFIIRKLNK